ncbi:hypothetical protein EDD11_005460 [Mortierella claussenii]|nr:hypothetical protein EDD11_005460 [Mortierella claussenii]
MAAISLITATAAASVLLAAVGARKVFKAVTAQRGVTLRSLRAHSHMHAGSAYPQDYYPGGNYAELSFGETHYFLFGPENGKKIVFVHGLSTPASVYKKIARHMADNGCCVLFTVNFARAEHDHSDSRSMWMLLPILQGGGIVSCFSHQFPEFVESLTFIAPGGLLLIPWVGKIFNLPYSEDIFSHQSIKGYFATKNVEAMRNEFKDHPSVPDCIEEAANILTLQYAHHAGYARGIMSTLRKFPLTGLRREYASSQEKTYPVQVIWGTKETVIPETTVKTLQELIPRIKVTKVEGATHSMIMTHPEAIIEQLEDFVAQHE